jgi:hypothetical protein
VPAKQGGDDFRRAGISERCFVCTYAHHVPGRLRLRLAPSTDSVGSLNAACDRLLTISAVNSARPNQLTGSIVVHYDSRIMHAVALGAAMQQLGFSPGPPLAGDAPGAFLTDRVADAALGKLFEYVVESLALAAIEAAFGASGVACR